MSTMTIRGLDDITIKALKKKAKHEGTSINAALQKIIKEVLGLSKEKRKAVYDDLDHLAGTWDKIEYQKFQNSQKYFESIDKNMWK